MRLLLRLPHRCVLLALPASSHGPLSLSSVPLRSVYTVTPAHSAQYSCWQRRATIAVAIAIVGARCCSESCRVESSCVAGASAAGGAALLTARIS